LFLLCLQDASTDNTELSETETTSSALLPSYLREEDPKAAALKISRQLLSLLQLSQEQAQQLCQVASALSRADASLNGAAFGAGWSTVLYQVRLGSIAGGQVKLDLGMF
jgi:hypothetical protein